MQETLLRKSMVLIFDEGIVDGKAVFKRYSYTNVNMSATAQNLNDGAAALATLYAGLLDEVQTNETNIVAA